MVFVLAADKVASARHVVAFINTLHRPDEDDVLADERAAAWLADWLGAGASSGADDIDRDSRAGLQTLREGLRELAAANSGIQPDGETLARAVAVLRSARLVVELGDHMHVPRLVAPADAEPAGRAIAAVAHAYLNIRATDDWSRVKVCAAPDCRWAYLDTSRNRSRRWCDMADCGNRAKNRTWRDRQRR